MIDPFLKSESDEELIINLTDGTTTFTGGTLKMIRSGRKVIMIAYNMTWASASSASNTSVIPARFRPGAAANIQNMFDADSTGIFTMTVTSGGSFSVSCRDWAGSAVSRTSTSNACAAWITT